MNDTITLSLDTVEQLVRYALRGLDTVYEDHMVGDEAVERNTLIHLHATHGRGHTAVQEAERAIYKHAYCAQAHDPNDNPSDDMSKNAEKLRERENSSYDFSDSKTAWIEGRRK